MKKLILPVLLAALILMMSTVDSDVSAVTTNPLVAEGAWIGDGDAIPVDVTGTVYPKWLTLVNSTGFNVTESQQICHAFPGGQLGWVADIRVKSGNDWLAVPTTQGWEPDEEGTYMACADVNWGTHALFAYYIEPEDAVKVLPECEYNTFMGFVYHPGWTGDTYTGWYFEAITYNAPFAEGTAVSYTITQSTNLPAEIQLTASGVTVFPGEFAPTQTVLFYPVSGLPSQPWEATFHLTFPTCYLDVVFINGPT